MGNFIKYKRIFGRYTDEQLQMQFDELIGDGWEIISYSETFVIGTTAEMTKVVAVMVVGKRNQVL